MAKKQARKDTPARKPSKVTRAKPPKPPQSQDLPGMEDRAIKPLEDLAAAYADIRDQRMDLSKEESSLKQHAITLMKQLGRAVYHRDGITITLITGSDDVKVKVVKAAVDD